MKKIGFHFISNSSLFLISLMLFLPPVSAQVPSSPVEIFTSPELFANQGKEKSWQNRTSDISLNARARLQECEDQLEYTAAKLSEIAALSFGSELSSREFGQRFSAPKEISLNGFRFFAYAGSGTNESFTYSISSSVYYVGTNGIPEIEPIFTDTTDIILMGNPTQDADVIQDINFHSSVRVDRPFVIGVSIQTETTIPTVVWTNSWENQDGRGEENSFTFFEGIGWSSNINSQLGGVALDMDYLVFPFVSYAIETEVPDQFCVEPNQPLVFEIGIDPIFLDPMYNVATFFDSTQESFFWDYGDGFGEKTLEAVRTYSAEFLAENPVFEVSLADTLVGWANLCSDIHRATVLASPQVELECETRGLTFECRAQINPGLVGFTSFSAAWNETSLEVYLGLDSSYVGFSGYGTPGENEVSFTTTNECFVDTLSGVFGLAPFGGVNVSDFFTPPEQVYQPMGIEPQTGLENRILVDIGYKFDDTFRYLQLFTYDNFADTVAWAGQNIPLLPPSAFFGEPTDETNFQYSIDGRLGGFFDEDRITSFSLGFYVTDTIETEPLPLAPSELMYRYEPMIWEIDYGNEGELRDSMERFAVVREDTLMEQRIVVDREDTLCYVLRHEYPNIELNNGLNPISDVYQGDSNACAPAGVSNGFQWLESQFPNLIQSGLSHREKLMQLSILLDRKNGKGAFPRDIIEGKLDFCSINELPVVVKFQHNNVLDDRVESTWQGVTRIAENKKKRTTSTGNTVDFTWILDELKHGEAVEVSYDIYEREGDDWVLKGSHLASINGAYFGRDGTKGIWILDDSRQCVAGGARNVFTELSPVGEGSDRADWFELSSLTDAQYKRVLKGVYSQSFDSSQVVISARPLLGEEGTPIRALSVFPNPSESLQSLTLQLFVESRISLTIDLLNVLGKQVKTYGSFLLSPGERTLELAGNSTFDPELLPGTYFLRVQDRLSGRVAMLKVLKTK